MKLTKIKTGDFTNHWTAEDTKYFTDIKIRKRYSSYSIDFILKSDVEFKHCFYGDNYISDLRLQSDVKKFIQELDNIYKNCIKEHKEEELAYNRAVQKRNKEIGNLNIYAGTPGRYKIGDFLNLKYANLNKNNEIGAYRLEVKNGDFYIKNSKIEKIEYMTQKKFDDFSINLLDQHDFLGGGGTASDDERIIDNTDEIFKWSDEDIQIFKDTSYSLVTAVLAINRAPIFVDAQGYKYARYVALKGV